MFCLSSPLPSLMLGWLSRHCLSGNIGGAGRLTSLCSYALMVLEQGLLGVAAGRYGSVPVGSCSGLRELLWASGGWAGRMLGQAVGASIHHKTANPSLPAPTWLGHRASPCTPVTAGLGTEHLLVPAVTTPVSDLGLCLLGGMFPAHLAHSDLSMGHAWVHGSCCPEHRCAGFGSLLWLLCR